jgi:hypothetical protein
MTRNWVIQFQDDQYFGYKVMKFQPEHENLLIEWLGSQGIKRSQGILRKPKYT